MTMHTWKRHPERDVALLEWITEPTGLDDPERVFEELHQLVEEAQRCAPGPGGTWSHWRAHHEPTESSRALPLSRTVPWVRGSLST